MLVDLAVNLFCQDHERVFTFYRDLLGAPEMVEHASPIYRGLKLPGVSLGFHAHEAYTLLDLVDYSAGQPSTGHYPTFNLDSVASVDALTKKAVDQGATVRKGPYTTYYKAYQVVLLDPERNVFRLNHYMSA